MFIPCLELEITFLEVYKMKRILFMLFCAFVVLTVFNLSIEASCFSDDSLNISEEIRAELETIDGIYSSGKGITMKVFNVAIPFAFGQDETYNIDEILDGPEVLGEYYIFISDESLFEDYSSSGSLSNPEEDPIIAKNKQITVDSAIVKWKNELVKSSNINLNSDMLSRAINNRWLKGISENIEVQSVYMLWGEPSHYGNAIYFKTSLGDYVYYNNYSNRQLGHTEYLFPADQFYYYQKCVVERMQEMGDLDGSIEYSNLFDITVFVISDINLRNLCPNEIDMNPENQDISLVKPIQVDASLELDSPPNNFKNMAIISGIVIGTVIVIAAVFLVVYNKKRVKMLNETPTKP